MKAPRPPATFTFDRESDLTVYDGPLWRIVRAAGEHPSTWDQLRRFGPVKGLRYDPWDTAPGLQDRGVMYAATDAVTAFAEVYQRPRSITRAAGGATLASWHPTRPLLLLDLTGTFMVRNGASASVSTGPKRFTQAWAARFDQQLGGEIDGLWHPSAMTAHPLVTLFERSVSVNSFPNRSEFHRALTDPLMNRLLARVATELSFQLR